MGGHLMPAPGTPTLPPISFLRMRRFMPQWMIEGDWSKGMIRDSPRASIPPGGVYNSVDYQLDTPGIAYKRGGWTYAGGTIGTSGWANVALLHADFSAGSQLLVTNTASELWKVAAISTKITTPGGWVRNSMCKPVFFTGGGKQYAIFPGQAGSSSVLKYNGTTAALMPGTIPMAGVCAIYKSRLVLANDFSTRNRLWFSPVTDTPAGNDIDQTWDTTTAWIDADYPVTGLAPLQNMLLIFSAQQTERLTGSTPPPGSDFDHATVGAIGCPDGKSISLWQNYAIFCNARSIFQTNGVGFRDLLQEAGLTRYWQGLLQGYDQSTWSIATGILWNKYLVVSVLSNVTGTNSTLVDCLICNLARNAWYRMSNLNARMFASSVGITDELYFAEARYATLGATSYVGGVASCWFPSSTNKNDANGVPVQPVLETRVLGASPNVKTYGRSWLDYDLRDAATDNPTLAVQVAPGLEATTFSPVQESPLLETPDELRKTVSCSKTSQGLSMRLTQNGPSAKTEIYSVELESISIGEELGTQ